MRRRWYETNSRLDKYRIHPSADDPYFYEWGTASAFEKICWYWNAYNTFALQFSAAIPAERILLLKAEDLFKGKTETIKGLYQFLGVECPSQDLIETVLRRKINHQVKGQFPVFEKWEESDYLKLLEIASKTMSALEYPLENGKMKFLHPMAEQRELPLEHARSITGEYLYKNLTSAISDIILVCSHF